MVPTVAQRMSNVVPLFSTSPPFGAPRTRPVPLTITKLSLTTPSLRTLMSESSLPSTSRRQEPNLSSLKYITGWLPAPDSAAPPWPATTYTAPSCALLPSAFTVGPVERIVRLRPRGHPSGLTGLGQDVRCVIRPDLRLRVGARSTLARETDLEASSARQKFGHVSRAPGR